MNQAHVRRDFRGRRWLSVVLRGVHLVTVIWLGAALMGVAGLSGHKLGMAVFATGAVLYGLDLWHKPEHLKELAGASMILKLLLVATMVVLPGVAQPLFWLIVVWSAVFSHAPGSFRNKPLFGRRQPEPEPVHWAGRAYGAGRKGEAPSGKQTAPR